MMLNERSAAVALFALLVSAGPAAAATWAVDPAKSTLTFAGTASGQAFTGSFKRFTATIDFDPAKPEGGYALVKVDTGSAATGDPQKDEMMPGAEFFDVSAFPQATFEAKGFRMLGPGQYQADGTLTIRDKTVPISLPFRFEQNGSTAHAAGSVDLQRQAYGVGQNAWASDENVASGVTVTMDLTATAK